MSDSNETAGRPVWTGWVAERWESLKALAKREPISRYLGHAALMLVIIAGVIVARMGFANLPEETLEEESLLVEAMAAAEETVVEEVSVDLPPFSGGGQSVASVPRLADVHTMIPTRPRVEIAKYVVQRGDTLFGIAEKFGLKPQSVLWGNWVTMEADPHTLRPGQELDIPPVDGVIHVWSAGESLTGIATFYNVAAEEIIDWPGNELDPSIDPRQPELEAGTLLVVPGGTRELPTWRSPRITRTDPARARVLGPGHCGKVYDGPIGAGVFIWPTPTKWLSGYPYTPGVHPAIDIGGKRGYNIYASDAGVIVYAGWNDWGYGNMIVIDHGNGWQTLYAHLSQVNMTCGQAVFQGNVIGLMGSTGNSSGPHLHFEMMNDSYGKVNPTNFLP